MLKNSDTSIKADLRKKSSIIDEIEIESSILMLCHQTDPMYA